MHIKDLLFEKDFSITITNKYIDISNYDQILEFSNDLVIVSSDKKVIIKGNNLTISKLLDNEILIIGSIYKIEWIS